MLAMEGGGDKGAYEVGALKAFVELLPSEEIQYDVVTGISVGAINAASFALHKKGDEAKCVNWMNELWLNMTSANIYSNWNFGMLEGVAFQEGLYNNAVGEKYLSGIFNENFPEKKFYREFEWNTIDFDSAQIVRFNKNEIWDTVPSKIIASASMPFAFPHKHIDNKTYVDGGSVWNIDIGAGINRCLNLGYKESSIVVDAILCTGKTVDKRDHKNTYNTLQNYMRMRDVYSYYNSMSDIDEIRRGYNDINFRHIVIPSGPLPSGYIPLGFKHKDIVAMIEQGYKEAYETIKNKTVSSFDKVHEIVSDLHNIYDPATTKNFRPMEIKSSA